jgi:uridylate kinase
MMKTLATQGHQIVVVVGGGTLAREFIGFGKDLGLNRDAQDAIAIAVSRLFALLLLEKMGDFGCNHVSLSVEDATNCTKEGKIAVMGGLKPGMTTDAVAAMVAEASNADLLIKATDQEGIFDKDPEKHPEAKKLEHLKLNELSRVCVQDKHEAGIHQIVDPEAIKILNRTRVKFIVVNGFKPKNVLTAINGEPIGTLID